MTNWVHSYNASINIWLLHITGSKTVAVFKCVTYVALTLCCKLWSFCIDLKLTVMISLSCHMVTSQVLECLVSHMFGIHLPLMYIYLGIIQLAHIRGCDLSQCLHCYKGGTSSQWEIAIFGHLGLRNPWTDRVEIWHGWLRHTRDPTCQNW